MGARAVARESGAANEKRAIGAFYYWTQIVLSRAAASAQVAGCRRAPRPLPRAPRQRTRNRNRNRTDPNRSECGGQIERARSRALRLRAGAGPAEVWLLFGSGRAGPGQVGPDRIGSDRIAGIRAGLGRKPADTLTKHSRRHCAEQKVPPRHYCRLRGIGPRTGSERSAPYLSAQMIAAQRDHSPARNVTKCINHSPDVTAQVVLANI